MRKLFIVLLGIVILSSLVIAQSIIINPNGHLKDSDFYLSLGDFLLKSGYEEGALAAYNRALEVEPLNKAVLNNLGYYYKEKNPLLAEDYFKKALEVDPGYEKARNNLALLYNKIGQYDKAVEQLRTLVESNPDKLNYNYDLAINLANKFYYQGKNYEDLVESIVYFKATYEIDKNFEYSLENIKVLEEIKRAIDNL